MGTYLNFSVSTHTYHEYLCKPMMGKPRIEHKHARKKNFLRDILVTFSSPVNKLLNNIMLAVAPVVGLLFWRKDLLPGIFALLYFLLLL